MSKEFPPSFWWGASTSAHQVEGDNHNDWSVWEKKKAKTLAKYGGEHEGARDPNNYISGKAADHFHHYPSDLKMAESIGLNAYRFSIEWSRIEPAEGEFSQEALDHYRRVIQAARARGLEPFVTLWHWTLPLWLSDRGGWRQRSTIKAYGRFVDVVVKAFGADVKYWITLNEPEVYAENVYQTGRWLAQRRNGFLFLWVSRNLVLAHRKAYGVVKKHYPGAWVGLSKHNMDFEPYRNRWYNKLLVRYSNAAWNHAFLNQTRKQTDFIGVNYYFHNRINLWQAKNENAHTSDMGWELYPKGLYHVLMDLARKYRKPIVITEHGLADALDLERAWYITESLKSVHQALAEGADVRGYFHWSLLDNFEWDSGFWPRFGLIEVNYANQKRTIRPSAAALTKIIKARRVN